MIESPRWLAVRGRSVEALALLQEVAKVNTGEARSDLVLAEEPRPAGQADAGFAALFTGDQAVVTFALTAMMFVSSGTYYGVTNAPGVATGVDDVYTKE